MTIDERLEQLTGLYQALAETVELLAADVRQIVVQQQQLVAENKERDRRLGQIMESIAQFVHVAEIHEKRIERLEGDQS
jgi:ABC-type transporter Mla subunit MlaD